MTDDEAHAAGKAARHGVVPRGQHRSAADSGGRFGRMFPQLPAAKVDRSHLDALVGYMGAPRAEPTPNRAIPAGYTYLGQFIDHDITFDPLSKLDRDNDPDALVNFRTPRLDLDSVFGSGPADQPFLYDTSRRTRSAVKLLVDLNFHDDDLANVDLPRNRQGVALLGDSRNDENLLVSQLHLLFLRFHNKVVDIVLDDHPQMGPADLFERARQIVRWHYQWIVIHDFLPKIAGDAASELGVRHLSNDSPAIPVEFSGAAYRFGHSMVRTDYLLKRADTQAVRLFAIGAEAQHLGGGRRLPADLEIEWDMFFFDPAAVEAVGPEQRSLAIDASISPPLRSIPPQGRSLPQLNLHRGDALGLPSGQDVATAMGAPTLDDVQLFPPDKPEDADDPLYVSTRLSDVAHAELLRATPLWYYVLREAEALCGGKCLGPVGGGIVAEVLITLLEADPHSYLREWPAWRPHLPAATKDDFTMLDLVNLVEGRSG